MHADLLQQASELAQLDPGRPRQANLRRAVSAVYYAVFHFLVDQSCRSVIGAQHAQAGYRQVLGRAFSHTVMKDACKSFSGGTLKVTVKKGLPQSFTIPVEIADIAATFVELQDKRHLADYDLTERFPARTSTDSSSRRTGLCDASRDSVHRTRRSSSWRACGPGSRLRIDEPQGTQRPLGFDTVAAIFFPPRHNTFRQKTPHDAQLSAPLYERARSAGSTQPSALSHQQGPTNNEQLSTPPSDLSPQHHFTYPIPTTHYPLSRKSIAPVCLVR